MAVSDTTLKAAVLKKQTVNEYKTLHWWKMANMESSTNTAH